MATLPASYRRAISAVVLVLAALVVPTCCTWAQTTQAPDTDFATDAGVKPYETYDGARENINLGSGNVNISLPLVNLPGRNGHDLSISLPFNSQQWTPVGTTYSIGPNNYYDLAWQHGNGYLGAYISNFPTLHAMGQVCGTEALYWADTTTPSYCYKGFVLTMEDGTKYSFPSVMTNSMYFVSEELCDGVDGCIVGWMSIPSADEPVGPTSPIPCEIGCTATDIGGEGPDMVLDAINGTVTFQDGSQLVFGGYFGMSEFWGPNTSGTATAVATSFVDTNGNVISYGDSNNIETWTDTLGRTVTLTPPIPNGTSGTSATSTLQYYNSNGQQQTITVNTSYLTTPLTPTFNVGNGFTYANVSVAPVSAAISSVVLPNGLTYTFQYNQYGELTKITYPSGGYTRYDYQAFTATYPWDSGNPNYVTTADYREVVAKHVCRAAVTPAGALTPSGIIPGPSSSSCLGSEDTTTYSPSINNWGVNQSTTVTDPLGNVTVYTFTGNMYTGPLESNRTINSGSSTLLKTIATSYVGGPGVYPTSVTTTFPNGLVSQVQYDYNEPAKTYYYCEPENRQGQTNIQQTTTCGIGAQAQVTIFPNNVTEKREYGFGQGAPGALTRKTDYAWLQISGSGTVDYQSPQIHILNRKTSEIVKDANGNQIASMTYSYDGYLSVIASSGATQHLATYNGGTNTTRGNLTAVSRWRNTDGAWLTTSNFAFDDAGNVLKKLDPLGHQTQYIYTDFWKNTTCVPTTGNAAAYVTTIINALNQNTTASYNSCTGTLASTTDLNNQPTTYSYDGMDRRVQSVNADGGGTCIQYSDSPNSSCPAFSGSQLPINIFTYKTITPGQYKKSTITLDGLSRQVTTVLNSDPDGPTEVDTTYDGDDRVASVTNPYRSTNDSTYGITSYVYDGLGRTCVLVPPDGTAVPNSTCPSAQPTNDAFTVYSSNSTTVTDEAGVQRRSVTDGLGRLVEVDEEGPTITTPGTSSTGSVTIGGSLQSKSVPSAPGTGSVTISGSERSTTIPATQATGSINFTSINSNSQSVTVGSYTANLSVPTNQGTNVLAQAAASALNNSGLVSTSYSGSTVYLTSVAAGSAGNYSISVSGASANTSGMSGGTNASTAYDTGTVSITVNGFVASTTYGNGSTSTLLATALTSALNVSGSPVTATSSGGVVSMQSKAVGTTSNYTLSVTSLTTNTKYFSGTSFPVTPSGNTLTGGTNNTLYDHGSISVTVNGSDTATVSYGQGDTPSTVVTKLASAFTGDLFVSATASGSVLTLTSIGAGAATNFPLSTSVTYDKTDFSSASFSAAPSGSAMTGGTDATLGSFSLSTPYVTQYTYNVLDNLTSVVQNGSRQRSFTYNSLSQLAQSTNPESNTTRTNPPAAVPTTYIYDLNGNLASKTMPAQNQQGSATVTLTYCYDVLNRLTAKGSAYSPNPPQTCSSTQPPTLPSPIATYLFDQTAYNGLSITYGVGHRTGMTDAAGSEAWSYDLMGRVLIDQRTTNSITKSTVYAYSRYVDGSVNTLKYPSGNTITFQTGGAERLLSAVDSGNSINFATGAHYAPQGALAALTDGSNLNSTFIFDKRLQPCWIYATTGTALPWNTTICTGSASAANILNLKYNFKLGAGDNGNVYGITNNMNSNRSQVYTYDGLNRIATAGTVNKSGTNCWSERYGIDAWGNLFSRGPDTTDGYAGSCGYVTPSSYFMNAVNQIASPSGFRYDTAGNMTQTGSASYNYNAENQMAAATTSGWATSTGYLYDGDGNRVAKLNTAGSATKLYWYSGGNVLDETDGTGSMSNTNFNEYVYFGGQRIARRNSSAVYYYVEDHLGTSREIVQAGQTLACYDADFYPYGGEMTITDTCDSAYKFTGKERDTESGLDNFGARYNTSSLGRFMTPDPIFMTKHRLVDPQQWNLYAYVRNNPLNLTDPTGKDLWEKGCGKDTATCHKDYVGTWDKDHKKFTPTKIQSDKNGNFKDHKVTMDTSGIHVDGKYQGVFASGTSATVVNGTGNLSGFQGSFSSNCLGHCEAEGTLSALPGHSFGQLLPTLRGPNEKLDRLSGHEGDQYRGGNKDGPDIHISYLNNRDAQSAHFDWAFPFGSAGGFAQHSADFVEIGIDKAMGKNSDPPYDEVGP